MKRKRENDLNDTQLCDLVLIDIKGRSIRVHKALLIDKSDYFAKILKENNLKELQLNEVYLIELIQYLYSNEADGYQSYINSHWHNISDSNNYDSMGESSETEILMHLLALSKKYSFNQLYRNLMTEINYNLDPSNVLTVYRCAVELNMEELRKSTKLMILSWLPSLQNSEAFYRLSEESINSIFSIEDSDIDNECKLNALSAWWSHNKEADMTSLWVKLITCSEK